MLGRQSSEKSISVEMNKMTDPEATPKLATLQLVKSAMKPNMLGISSCLLDI